MLEGSERSQIIAEQVLVLKSCKIKPAKVNYKLLKENQLQQVAFKGVWQLNCKDDVSVGLDLVDKLYQQEISMRNAVEKPHVQQEIIFGMPQVIRVGLTEREAVEFYECEKDIVVYMNRFTDMFYAPLDQEESGAV